MYSRIACSSRPTVLTKYPLAQKCCPTKLRFLSPYTRARWIALLPLMNPTTCDTAYFGGIEISMCTWSGIKCPSSIFDSFCAASLRNTSPRCRRSSRYSVFVRHFGMKTTWYLQSHVVWLQAWYSSIGGGPSVCVAAHGWKSADGLSDSSNCYCLPGRAGGSPADARVARMPPSNGTSTPWALPPAPPAISAPVAGAVVPPFHAVGTAPWPAIVSSAIRPAVEATVEHGRVGVYRRRYVDSRRSHVD